MYIAATTDNSVAVFSRNSSTGALTFVEVIKDTDAGVDGLDQSRGVVVSPDGSQVFAVGGEDDAVVVFDRDSSTGALTFAEFKQDEVDGVDGLDGIGAVAISPDGSHLYTVGVTDDAVSAFSLTSASTFTPGTGRVLLNNTVDQSLATTFNDLYINDGLVGYWTFDETSGTTAADSSGYGNDGTHNGPTISSTVPSLSFDTDRSLSFDGNDYVRVSDSPELNSTSWTLSAWIKTSSTGLGRIINKPNTNSGGNFRFLIFINGGKAFTEFNNSAGAGVQAAGTTTISDNQWHHIAAVFDDAGNSLAIYVDGNADATTATTETPRSSTGDAFMGWFSDGFGQFYSGLLDDARIYDRALSSTEIGRLADGDQPQTSIATTTLAANLDVNGSLYLNSGTLDASTSNYAINVAKSWYGNGGVLTPRSGTVTLDGTATGNTLLSGSQAFYNLTVNGTGGAWTTADSLTVSNNLTVIEGSLTTGSDLANAEIEDGGTLALSNDATVSGDFVFRSGGTFTHNDNKVTFDGATTQDLTAEAALAFEDLTVTSGTTLIETESDDNATYSGTLDNSGTIRKTQAVSGTPTETFGLTGATVQVTANTNLSSLRVDRVDSDHANAPTDGLKTGRYWSVTPTGSTYIANLTVPFDFNLPNSGTDHAVAQLCRYDGSGSAATDWDCARSSSSASATIPGTATASPTMTRNGITAFSDWTVGDPEVDLTVVKNDSPDPVLVSETLTYTPFTVTNNGPFPSTNAVLTDTLPAEVTFVSATFSVTSPVATDVACTENAGTVTCNIGAINSGATASVTLTVTAPATATTPLETALILNSASVTALEFDPVSANNSATSGSTVITPTPGTNALTFSATWFTGSMTLDADADGNKTDTTDTLYFAISDVNSDGRVRPDGPLPGQPDLRPDHGRYPSRRCRQHRQQRRDHHRLRPANPGRVPVHHGVRLGPGERRRQRRPHHL